LTGLQERTEFAEKAKAALAARHGSTVMRQATFAICLSLGLANTPCWARSKKAGASKAVATAAAARVLLFDPAQVTAPPHVLLLTPVIPTVANVPALHLKLGPATNDREGIEPEDVKVVETPLALDP